jgi:hypothetical protein
MGRAVLVMNEADAWTYLAEAWMNAYRSRRRTATGPEHRRWYGLCAGVGYLRAQRWISRRTYQAMIRTLNDTTARSGRKDCFAWPSTVEGARARALFCRRMARRAARRTASAEAA